MRRKQELTEEEKWQIVKSSTKDYDGVFYYGVRTTGIFCRPSCRARAPLRENIAFYSTPQEAMAEGLRPCKRCRPDIGVFEPEAELVNKAKALMKENYDKQVEIGDIAKELGVSANHFIRLFKGETGITPISYIIGLRVERAEALIRETDMRSIDIAYSTGFTSLSNFYRALRRAGIKPSNYRSKG